MITLKCAACGFVSDVDMRDKLTTFILKNPPEQKKTSKDKKAMRRAEKERLKEGEAADEEQKKLKKEANETEPADESDDDVQWKTDPSVEAAQQRIKEQLSAGAQNGTKSGNNQERLVDEIKEYLKKGPSAVKLKNFLGSLSGTSQEIIDALFEALFMGIGKGLAKEVAKKKTYLAAVTQEDRSQSILLRAIESFCGKSNPEAVKEVGLVLKALYDNDLLEEEFILEWYKQGLAGGNKNSKIWKNVKPFIEWLQSAESESEEE
ncbi:unnamed protein product, partial [Vitis vinifera]